MATTAPKKKITDYFDSISNPSGGLSSLFKGTSAPSNKISQLLLQNSKPSALTPMMPATPAVAPSRSEALGGRAPAPVSPVVRNDAPSRSAALGGPAPVFSGSAVPRETAPVVPQPVAAPSTSEIPPQWLNADGSFKSPDQIASEMGATLRNSQGGGDVGALALGQFGGAEKTAEQLRAEAMQINNTRNDIAVGETDPYKVASKSGIAYTPAELNAIEKAYAGIYDPSLTTALAKVEQKQIEDAAARETEAQTKRDEQLFKNELQQLAISHDYDLDKMAKSYDYDVMLQTMKDKATVEGASGMTPYSDERSQRSVQSVDELLPQIDENPGIFGRSAAAPIPDFLRSDSYRNFKTELDTLKASVAFNELTAMREASKTGGALGNVSNIELALLESALAGLRMDQTPENLKEQLTKVKDSVNRWRMAQGAAAVGVSSGGESIPEGTDGASYGYPGYVSDGTQWVLNE